MKNSTKLVNKLYQYSQVLGWMPPSGDGAKMETAKEVHQVTIKLLNRFIKASADKKEEIGLMLLELVEQMILDKIDDTLTVEEMVFREELE